ncbi:Putative uncharacterized protein [Thermotoga neapolitana DSM 4359]|uniref:Uncharacterized protein n=1 Tax=Thermotoga neapolitana (strain ATCC 49049 / DSM 4359 / NBRC 107923 / NS-E) TaxID=309803 RepID=B9K8T2_THENN|nr:Putative uncharacterized protein [Thermotoga neapolitana DSM 4359]
MIVKYISGSVKLNLTRKRSIYRDGGSNMERIRDFFILIFCVVLFLYEITSLSMKVIFKRKKSRETAPGLRSQAL